MSKIPQRVVGPKSLRNQIVSRRVRAEGPTGPAQPPAGTAAVIQYRMSARTSQRGVSYVETTIIPKFTPSITPAINPDRRADRAAARALGLTSGRGRRRNRGAIAEFRRRAEYREYLRVEAARIEAEQARQGAADATEPAPLPVHNHGLDPSCAEQVVEGQLLGDCGIPVDDQAE